MQKFELAVIGEKSSILAFKAAGIETIAAVSEKEINSSIENLVRKKCKVIFITENAAQKASEIIEKYKSRTFPIILPIPDRNGASGLGIKNIYDNVEKAIGTRSISNL